MEPTLTTAPGRIDIHVGGERFASYEADGDVPGFVSLSALGTRPITQPDRAVGRALWIGHRNVNGLDFLPGGAGDGPRGRIVSGDLLVRRGTLSVGFQHECHWLAPDGECILRDMRTARAASGPSSGALLDITVVLIAMPGGSVALGPAGDSLICLRAANALQPAYGGQIRNSEDQFGPEAIHGRQASWCMCTGVVGGETVGLAFLDHPENPWHPPPWVCREDGVISPSPFAWRTVEIAAGERLALRYRIVVHSGYVEPSWVHARLADWVRETS
jgi:hypothetical protein